MSYAQTYSLGPSDAAAHRARQSHQCPASKRDASGASWPRKDLAEGDSDEDDVERNPSADVLSEYQQRSLAVYRVVTEALNTAPLAAHFKYAADHSADRSAYSTSPDGTAVPEFEMRLHCSPLDNPAGVSAPLPSVDCAAERCVCW